MARKGFNFINSLRDVFRRKHSNIQPEVKASENIKEAEKVEKKTSKSIPRQTKKVHAFGGCNDRGLGAIYHKPPRGKFKGYMREAS